MADSITITSPTAYQCFQRDRLGKGQGKADVRISGTYVGSPTAIEASWNGGAYQTIVSSPTGGTYSSKLPLQSVGSGALTVRFASDHTVTASVTPVNVGSRWVVSGQSNSICRLANPQSYTGTAGWGSLFTVLGGTSGAHAVLADPTDNTSGGSFWPLFGSYVVNQGGVPCEIIPGPGVNATTILNWQPSANPFLADNFFGTMTVRAMVNAGLGGVEGLIFLLGESDAQNGTTQATFVSRALTFMTGVRKYLACPCVWPKLGTNLTGAATINAALAQIFQQVGDVIGQYQPPDYNNAPHWTTDPLAATIAAQMWATVQPLFYAAVGSAPLVGTGGLVA